ncbi:MAG: hypothetical protein ACRDRU_28910 [Pseudonocardiaceae bacterium]
MRQLCLCHQLTAVARDDYPREGLTIVAQNVIVGEHLTEMVQLIQQRPPLVVALAPRSKMVAPRETARAKNAYSEWTTAPLNNGPRNDTPRLGL